jgi:hypothetical protein
LAKFGAKLLCEIEGESKVRRQGMGEVRGAQDRVGLQAWNFGKRWSRVGSHSVEGLTLERRQLKETRSIER